MGGIKGLESVISDSLASPVREVHAAIQKAPVVNADETGWREANQRVVLWNANTPEMAIFQIAPKKDHATPKLCGLTTKIHPLTGTYGNLV